MTPAGPVHRRIPEGDNRERLICDDCGYIVYDNPKIVVGTVAIWDDKVLLVKRAIEPRQGFWTLPAGFMEQGETSETGALRETWEEAKARVELDRLLAVYNVLRVNQVHLFYRARMQGPEFEPGSESLAVDLYAWDDIPWNEIAFPTVKCALENWYQTRDQPVFPAFTNPEDELFDLPAFVAAQEAQKARS